jgi:hypothetical protein
LKSNDGLTERETFKLKATLREMYMQSLHRLANDYNVDIPMEDMDSYSVVESLMDGLSIDNKRQLLDEIGDAGKKSIYLYYSKEKTPEVKVFHAKSLELLHIKNESQFWDTYPYYDDVKNDVTNNCLKIRFHYLHGLTYVLDEYGREKEQRYHHTGVAVYRSGSKMLEVRTQHKSMADKIAADTTARIGLAPFFSIDLLNEELIDSFVEWVRSLNSATIELSRTDETAGSLRITARKGMDLRTAEKLKKELKTGHLRSVHVTTEHNEVEIYFRINFADCHITYTRFTVEPEITYVTNELEKIIGGYEFDKPERTLTEFFGKD